MGATSDLNWYAYVENNPTNHLDPLGQFGNDFYDSMVQAIKENYSLGRPSFGLTRAQEQNAVAVASHGGHASLQGNVSTTGLLAAQVSAGVVIQTGGLLQAPDIGITLGGGGQGTINPEMITPKIGVDVTLTAGPGPIDTSLDQSTEISGYVPVDVGVAIGPVVDVNASGQITDVGVGVSSTPGVAVSSATPSSLCTLLSGCHTPQIPNAH